MPKASTSVDFGPVIFCEDIRKEADGRFSLMGVISAPIIFETDDPEAEAPEIELGFFVETSFTDSAEVDIRFIREGSKSCLMQVSGGMRRSEQPNDLHVDREWGTIALAPKVMEIDETGSYLFQVKVNGGKWKTLKSLDIYVKKANKI